MRLQSKWMTMLVALPLLAFGSVGCGGTHTGTAENASGGSRSTTSAAGSKAGTTSTAAAAVAEKAPQIDIRLTSSAPAGVLSARYTCDGSNVSPVFRWSGVPKGMRELDLFVLSTLPVHGKFDVAWAVAGINPRTTRISSAKLPRAVVIGRNSAGQDGYSLCPAAKSYTALIYALPRKVSVSRGFQAEPLVNNLVRIAGHEGSLFFAVSPR